jgi:hypothetical protein
MARRIGHIISAEGWYAVFARTDGVIREHAVTGSPRPGALSRAPGGAVVPEFLPLVAWALVIDDAGGESDRVVGIIVQANQQTEVVLSDDPSFLGYAGPGDPGIDRSGRTPDWRALARQAMADLKQEALEHSV